MLDLKTTREARVVALQFGVFKKTILEKILKQKTIDFKKDHDVVFSWGYAENMLKHKNIIFVEDGFIRSVGLGVEMNKPLSWVFDKKGIYYNPHRRSDLEDILLKISMNDQMIERVNRLKQILVSNNITKYNLESRQTELRYSKKNILVIGQVDEDLSINYGANYVKNNFEFLKKVRFDFPDKYIIYKPHPDYESGLRSSSSANKDMHLYADKIIKKASIIDALHLADIVVVNTSLSGFEALIRDKEVVCYGEPFYSGWGLTKDMYVESIKSRRNRKLLLEELMYGCLVIYPNYFHPETHESIEIEEAIQLMSTEKPRNLFLKLLVNHALKLLIRLKKIIKN
jgi:capsular polysaccharide export protein